MKSLNIFEMMEIQSIIEKMSEFQEIDTFLSHSQETFMPKIPYLKKNLWGISK